MQEKVQGSAGITPTQQRNILLACPHSGPVRLTWLQALQCEPVWAFWWAWRRWRAGGGRQEKGPQADLHMGHVSSCFNVACKPSSMFRNIKGAASSKPAVSIT